MKKWITILSGLLVAQLVLAMTINLTSQDYGAFQPEQKLLTFDDKTVDGLRIEDGTDSVVLSKREDKWLLPESGDLSPHRQRKALVKAGPNNNSPRPYHRPVYANRIRRQTNHLPSE